MAYATHAKLPDLSEFQWVSEYAPPAIGAPIIATINACGPAIVAGYFTQDGFLGVLCNLIAPPDWHVKQAHAREVRGMGRTVGHVFGPEWKPADTAHDTATAFGRGCFAQDWLSDRVEAASLALKAVPGIGTGTMGLTPDEVKASEAYRIAKLRYDNAHARLREYNRTFVKTFKADLAKARIAKREAMAAARKAVAL